jgi:phage shock protein E
MHRRTCLASLLLAFLVASAAQRTTADEPDAIEHTTDALDDIRRLIAKEKAVLVDVREEKEWKEGRLADAMLLSLSSLSPKLARKSADEIAKDVDERLDKRKIVYVHCASGKRSLLAAEILRPLGYDVRPLRPGFKELLKAGFPEAEKVATEKPTPP